MSETFYSDQPAFLRFEDIADFAHYGQAPRSWDVVLTDVRGSTKAIEAGRYKDVNAVGVAAIVGIRNALPNLDLPFVFGGDGATVLTPSSKREIVRSALEGLRRMARDAFDFDLRTGIVPITEVENRGTEVRVGRFQASEHASFAVFCGGGIALAETLLKAPATSASFTVVDGHGEVDLSGFECRWQPIASRQGKMVSLIVQARGESTGETIREVLQAIEKVIPANRSPVSSDTLHLAQSASAFDQEARIRSGRATGASYWFAVARARALAGIGRVLLKKKKDALGFPGDVYRAEVVTHTDFRKFDDTLRMVLDVTEGELAALKAVLEAKSNSHEIAYGMHVANSALMTCMVTDFRKNHLHFVDGDNGGYALAAKALKLQLRSESES